MLVAMTPSAAVASPPHRRCLLDDHFPVPSVDNECQDSRPEEEHRLHDPQRKARFQHRAGLIDLQVQVVLVFVTKVPKRAKRHPHRAAIPVSAIGVRDEAELVDSSDESAEEKKVDEGDEERRALRCRMADERIEGPEDGDHTDNEKHQDVGRGDLVCFEIAVDEVGLFGMLGSWKCICQTSIDAYHHANDRNQEYNLHQAVEDEEQTSNHLVHLSVPIVASMDKVKCRLEVCDVIKCPKCGDNALSILIKADNVVTKSSATVRLEKNGMCASSGDLCDPTPCVRLWTLYHRRKYVEQTQSTRKHSNVESGDYACKNEVKS